MDTKGRQLSGKKRKEKENGGYGCDCDWGLRHVTIGMSHRTNRTEPYLFLFLQRTYMR